ncbi:hypothetical protein B0A50_00206 [Salinomyces thailandicus]|uniref:CDC45-like protein n=1 Tax=Salinomyces thailandicus TaxID=706561 RepID=A0A4U0UHL3_9PEZI|nr:hypothetical protein B0A50_00206 [Salinomyces thailandica]
MYIPRPRLVDLYTRLIATSTPTQPPLLILTALTVDALCAVRILTALLKRDFLPHTLVPVAGYADLQAAGERLVRPLRRGTGGEGGRVICIGCGGGVDLGELLLGLEEDGEEEEGEERGHGVEVWVVDARRPWNLENVFGNDSGGRRERVKDGRVLEGYQGSRGGVIVWDDGDIEREMDEVREAWLGLRGMPEVTEEDVALAGAEDDREDRDHGAENDEQDGESGSSQSKRKRSPSPVDDDSDQHSDDERPRQRRRSNSSVPIPSSPGGNPFSNQAASPLPDPAIKSPPPRAPSLRQQKSHLLRLRRRYESTLQTYYDAGTWTSDPVSIMLYSLAEDLGREDNDLLWLAIVGVESIPLSPFNLPLNTANSSSHSRTTTKQSLIKTLLTDEVHRLNPPSLSTSSSRSSTPALRLTPDPPLPLLRHWTLYDSLLHSPSLAHALQTHRPAGLKRLHKLLAKMGISLSESHKGWPHLDPEVKRTLGERLGRLGEWYGVGGLIPDDNGGRGGKGWGFVRSWGWGGEWSAVDVAVVVSAILDIGSQTTSDSTTTTQTTATLSQRPHQTLTPPSSSPTTPTTSASTTSNFFTALDALRPHPTKTSNPLTPYLPLTQNLYRAINRTGSALLTKNSIRNLRTFRLGVIKAEDAGGDAGVFCQPGALGRLGGWVWGALAGAGDAASGGLVLACLDAERSVWVVVGLGGGDSDAGDGVQKKGKTAKDKKQRAEEKQRKLTEKATRKAAREAEKASRRRLRRDRRAANGDFDSSDAESSATESCSSISSSSTSSSTSSSSSSSAGKGSRKAQPFRNPFPQAFQAVAEATGARVRLDAFEHCVVEVRKEDLAGFLEEVSLRGLG